MDNSYIGILSLAAILVMSCGRRGTECADMLPYIRETISDTSSVEHSILTDYDPDDRYGTVAVIGPEEDTRMLTGYLRRCDIFDNIDASVSRDSLPDFAGETFSAYYDLADSSYSSFFKKGLDEGLREVTVRNAVFAAASGCYQNTFSHEPTVDKTPAKVMIYSSSYSETGIADVDTLFSAFGKKVRVISPVRAVSEQIASEGVTGRIGIWADRDILASGVYASVLHSHTCNYDYVGFSPDGFSTAEEGFFRFLDMYLSTGEVIPLSAVVIDDFALSAYAEYIREVAVRVNSSTEDDFALYRAILADDFKIIDAVTSVAKECYRMLRTENFFTHRIQYPQVKEYMILPSSGPDNGIKYLEYNKIYVH